MIARRLLVRGRVQGVGFRWWTATTARAGGLAGWVRNRADGSVEIHVEGDAAAIDGLIDACRDGPPAARVTAVEVRDVEADGATGFEQRPTA